MKFKKTFVIFLITLILLNLTIIFATAKNNNNISNFFRIHIVANSDSINDQLLKYTVAKEVDEYICLTTKDSNSKEESKKIIKSKIKDILKLCENIIISENYNYDIKAYIGKIEYDEKQKDEIYMSAGIYDSLKIIIGNGNGNNWWSLIYPASIDSTANEETNNNTEYRLYIVEWFKELFSKE